MAEIKVVVKDETGQEEIKASNDLGSSTINKINNSTSPSPATTKKAQTNSKALAAASLVASKTLNYTTSNIGKWTGNQAYQQKFDNFSEAIGIATATFISPWLAIASVGMNLATTAINTATEQRDDNIAKAQLRARAGYNSLNELKGWRH